MNQKADLTAKVLENIPWKSDSNPIWPFTAFILRRNVAKYYFPNKLSKNESSQIQESLKTVLLSLPEMKEGFFFKKEELGPLDKELLLEHFLFMEGFPESANGSSILIDSGTQLMNMINVEDHLEMRIIDSKGNLENSWNALSKMENSLGNHFDFAFSPRFGHLTSDPNKCGTALLVHAYLHLPALIQTEQLSEIWIKQNDESLIATGLSGNPEDMIGDMFVLQNNYTLGVNEDAILRSIKNMASKLILAEKTIRAHIKKEGTAKIKDKISKAYGLLIHSYELEVKEALNLLSLIKLGLDLGWISAIENSKLDELFFKCRRGHLSHLFPDSQDLKQIAHKRAEFLHSQLKGIQLVI